MAPDSTAGAVQRHAAAAPAGPPHAGEHAGTPVGTRHNRSVAPASGPWARIARSTLAGRMSFPDNLPDFLLGAGPRRDRRVARLDVGGSAGSGHADVVCPGPWRDSDDRRASAASGVRRPDTRGHSSEPGAESVGTSAHSPRASSGDNRKADGTAVRLLDRRAAVGETGKGPREEVTPERSSLGGKVRTFPRGVYSARTGLER